LAITLLSGKKSTTQGLSTASFVSKGEKPRDLLTMTSFEKIS